MVQITANWTDLSMYHASDMLVLTMRKQCLKVILLPVWCSCSDFLAWCNYSISFILALPNILSTQCWTCVILVFFFYVQYLCTVIASIRHTTICALRRSAQTSARFSFMTLTTILYIGYTTRWCKKRRDRTEVCNRLVTWATWPWQCIHSVATLVLARLKRIPQCYPCTCNVLQP